MRKSAIYLIALCSIILSAATEEQKADYWIDKGNEFYNKGSYELAINCYNKALQIDSRNITALSQKGLSYAFLYKYSEMLSSFNEALELEPKNASIWEKKGLSFFIIAQRNKTIEDTGVNLTSEPVRIMDNTTSLQKLTGSVKSKATWNHSVDVLPGTRRIAAGMTTADKDCELLLLFEKPNGEPEDADLGTGTFGPIQALNPIPGIWRIRVYGYEVDTGKNEIFNINLIKQMKSPEIYNSSLEALDEAMKLDPESIEALNKKAMVLSAAGKFNESVELIDRSLEIDPLNAVTWDLKGAIFNEWGLHIESIQYFNNAIDLDPFYVSPWANEAQALNNLGLSSDANRVLERARELGYEG